MDVFKILARSTNVQQSAPTSTITQIPSAGFGLSSEDPATHRNCSKFYQGSPRGIKRKREEVEKGPGHDFLGNRRPSARHQEKPTQGVLGTSNNSRKTCQTNGALEAIAPRLSGEECRRVLKQHQLKITALHSAADNANPRSEKQERPRSKSTKNVYNQISPQPLISFHTLHYKYGVSKRLIANMTAQGYEEPTDIQLGSLPLLCGTSQELELSINGANTSDAKSKCEMDLLAIAPTGSGKTLCFLLHILHNLLVTKRIKDKAVQKRALEHQVQALIIVPTHELADQIANEGRKLAVGTGIKISALQKNARLQHSAESEYDDIGRCCNGTSQTKGGEERLSKLGPVAKADVLVSTPLMLAHAISASELSSDILSNVEFLILDEADVLLETTFRDQTMGILQACTHASLRVSLWSATISSSIESLAQSFILDRRRKLSLQSKHHFIIRLVVGLKDTAISKVSHRMIYAASEQGKLLAVRQLLHPHVAFAQKMLSLQPPFLIFVQTIPRAIALHSELLYDMPFDPSGPSRIAVLHSGLSVSARSTVIDSFRRGEIWILIATDLLSRGVDFRGVNGIINYDIPNTATSYIHRVGRTARQGREGGIAITLYTKEDVPYLRSIANIIAVSEKAATAHGQDPKGDMGTQKWLLDVLPKVAKKTKKALKLRGVEGRRVTAKDGYGKVPKRSRISTKSGYDRRQENKRRGVFHGNQGREAQVTVAEVGEDNDIWGGLED